MFITPVRPPIPFVPPKAEDPVILPVPGPNDPIILPIEPEPTVPLPPSNGNPGIVPPWLQAVAGVSLIG